MTAHSPVMKALAQLFTRSHAGRKGRGLLDFQPELKAVLSAADCEDGDLIRKKKESARCEFLSRSSG